MVQVLLCQKNQWISILLAGVLTTSSNLNSQTFHDIAAARGLSGSSAGFNGNGLSFYDWDLDGFDDVVLTDEYEVRFFKNTNGVFEQVNLPGIEPEMLHAPSDASDANLINSVSWVDINNDGAPEIAFNRWNGKFKLFLNDGNFNFTDISESSGISQFEDIRGYGQAWADYDKDGLLDLYVCNYQNFSHTNYLYHNNGDNTFTNVTVNARVGNEMKATFIALWIDYDKDSWLDLWVFNDRILNENSLYRNLGDGTFDNVSIEAHVNDAFDPMSATLADFNGDGWPDVYSTNTYGNYLYINNGDGTFSEQAADYGVQLFVQSWGAIASDFDGDQHEDLFVAASDYTNTFPGLFAFKRLNGGFELIPDPQLSTTFSWTYAAAMGDINNDGRSEFLHNSRLPNGVGLHEVQDVSYNSLKFRLQGVNSNRDAIGSTVEVWTNGMRQLRYIQNGEQYLAQNSQWKILSLADYASADSVVIHWPNGGTGRYLNVPANQNLVFIEGENINPNISITGNATPCIGDTVWLGSPGWETYLWSNGESSDVIAVTESGEYSVIISSQGVEYQSELVSIEFTNPQAYELQINSDNCSSSPADLSIVIDGNSVPELVLWNGNSPGQVFNVAQTQVVDYQFIDAFGCFQSGSQEVVVSEEIVTELTTFYSEQSSCGQAWSGFATVAGGSYPYIFNWSFYLPGQDDPFLIVPDSVFTCLEVSSDILARFRVSDASGCDQSQVINLQALSVNPLTPKSNFTAYPNPCENTLNLSFEGSDNLVLLLDIYGRVLGEFQFYGSTGQIDLTRNPKGIYQIQHVSQGSSHVSLVVKN